MKIARFRREIRIRTTDRADSRTLSVWGFSDRDERDALNQAEQKASRLRQYLVSGFPRDRQYNYRTGYLREEIVEELPSGGNTDRTDNTVITRNAYGALVINCSSVLFGDIDVPPCGPLGKLKGFLGRPVRSKQHYLDKIAQYQSAHPHLTIRVYETCAGLRFIVTNCLFEPGSMLVSRLFSELEVDPLYQRLCKVQDCFRARISPKPWRLGLAAPAHRFPATLEGGSAAFQQWLESYEKAAAGVAVTRLMDTFGTSESHPLVGQVIAHHDRSMSDKPCKLA